MADGVTDFLFNLLTPLAQRNRMKLFNMQRPQNMGDLLSAITKPADPRMYQDLEQLNAQGLYGYQFPNGKITPQLDSNPFTSSIFMQNPRQPDFAFTNQAYDGRPHPELIDKNKYQDYLYNKKYGKIYQDI